MNKSDIRFVTLFPRCRNVELLKDVGMIPYCLHKNYGYQSSIACYQNEEKYPYSDHEVKGLRLEFMKRTFRNVLLDGILYLIKNAKSINILNVYHLVLGESLIWICVYKLLNPSGYVYLKLDMDFRGMQKHEQDVTVKKYLKKKLLKKANFISAESKEICRRMAVLYQIPVKCVPNGYFESEYEFDDLEKENVFLTVGRLGTEQKATELLLQAFARVADKHDWKLRLVGSAEPEFTAYKNEFFAAYPELAERVIFTGAISDKKNLQEEYAKAKVFLLPSRWEGFPLTLPEAMRQGCYIIVSDAIPPARELINEGKYGICFESGNEMKLADAMVESIKIQNFNILTKEIKKYTEKTLNWNRICEILYSNFTGDC